MGLIGAFGGVGEEGGAPGPPPSAALGNDGSCFPMSRQDSSALSQLLLCLYELSFFSHPSQGSSQPLRALLPLSTCGQRVPLCVEPSWAPTSEQEPRTFQRLQSPCLDRTAS